MSSDAQIGVLNLGPFIAIAVFLANLMASIAVCSDARRRTRDKLALAFFSPSQWFLMTLVGSFLVVGLYWLMHYSTLRRPDEFPE